MPRGQQVEVAAALPSETDVTTATALGERSFKAAGIIENPPRLSE